MKPLAHPTIALLLASALVPALAQAPAPADGHDSHHPTAASAAPATPATPGAQVSTSADQSELSEGEITRWDPRTLKVTLRHGEIKNLGMPPMTMVFRVNDAGMLAPFQPGDKVRFRVERQSTGYFITRMEAAR
jgi:Cu/Ag efflux protein CusF